MSFASLFSIKYGAQTKCVVKTKTITVAFAYVSTFLSFYSKNKTQSC